MSASQASLLSMASSPPEPLASFTFDAGSGAFTLAWPAGHDTGDLGILLVETCNEALATPAGWTSIYAPTGTGVAGANTSTRLYAFYRYATSNAEAAASIGDSGNEQLATMIALRGAAASSPIEAVATDTGVSANGCTVPTATTLGDNRYVVGACSNAGNPGSGNACCTWTPNGNLSNFVELTDYSAGALAPSQLGSFGGQKLAAGAVGTTAGTFSSPGVQERLIFAVKPFGA